jgi:hypothetical protein
MTGRQEYDRTKDRQRILGKYMIDKVSYVWERGIKLIIRPLTKKN